MSLVFNHVDLTKPTLVLVDTSVAMHRFSQGYAGVDHKDPKFLPLLKANMLALASCTWLPPEIQDTVVSTIFTLDVKQNWKYWRHDWLLDPENYLRVKKRLKKLEALRVNSLAQWLADGTVSEEAHDKLSIKYKAGRSLPDYRFKKIKTNLFQWLMDPQNPLAVNTISKPYYESDDCMAAVVHRNRAKGSPYNIIIYTVDADLLGLVDEAVTWVCMHGYDPGIRDTVPVINSWGNRPDSNGTVKLGEITIWRDVWVRKGEKGDASDNLPASAGVLLPVIDLLDPPAQHRLWEDLQVVRSINTAVAHGSAPNILQGARAVKYIVNSGFVPSFKSYSQVPITGRAALSVL